MEFFVFGCCYMGACLILEAIRAALEEGLKAKGQVDEIRRLLALAALDAANEARFDPARIIALGKAAEIDLTDIPGLFDQSRDDDRPA